MTGSKAPGGGISFWLQVVALLVAAVAVAVSLAFTNRQVEHLREETRRFNRSYAELIGYVATDTSETITQLDLAVSQLISQYDFPWVVTDTTGRPLSWRGVGDVVSSEEPADLEQIAERVREFDRQFEPIPIRAPGAPQVFHFGEPPEVRRLRIFPYVQLGLMAVVLILIWWSLRAGLARQRSQLWVGLARESAHQFGTPISSLQGWMRLLQDRLAPPPGEVGVERRGGREPPLQTIVEAMGEDVERLTRITNRFGKIGSPAAREPVDLDRVARSVVEYIRGRAPQRDAVVEIIEEYGAAPVVCGQEELLEWVIENLLKNAMDALGGKEGEIRVRTLAATDGRSALLQVEDTGAGITPADQRRIFDPGFSRKRRGWGLGLALSRRLVESYGGRLRLVRSRPGEGSLFEVAMPVMREVDE